MSNISRRGDRASNSLLSDRDLERDDQTRRDILGILLDEMVEDSQVIALRKQKRAA